MKIKPRNLKFPIRNDMGKTNALRRWVARIVSANILNKKIKSFQFGGPKGEKSNDYYLITADKVQLVQWILTSHGYSCCCAEISERIGERIGERK